MGVVILSEAKDLLSIVRQAGIPICNSGRGAKENRSLASLVMTNRKMMAAF